MVGSAFLPAKRCGADVGSVVAEDLIDGHVVGPEPLLGSPPELHQRRPGFVVVGFDIGDTGVGVDRDVQIHVAHTVAAGAFDLNRAASVDPPAAPGGILPTFS